MIVQFIRRWENPFGVVVGVAAGILILPAGLAWWQEMPLRILIGIPVAIGVSALLRRL
jgi:hypothetical protein